MKNFLVIFIFLCQFLPAFPVYFKHFGMGDGLSQTSVMSIYQDILGRMWFGTREGITIYDGYNTIVYKPWADEKSKTPTEVLHGNECDFICGNSDGDVFFRSDGALMRYDIRKQHFQMIHTGGVRALTTNHGEVWCAIKDSLFTYNTAGDSLQFREKTNINAISRLLISGDNIWIGARNALYLLEKGKEPKVVIPDKEIYSLFESSVKDIWAGTRMEGLYRIKADGTTTGYFEPTTPNKRTIASNQIREFIEDNYGNIWFGTFKGLQKFNPYTEEFTLYTRDNLPRGLSHASVFSLYFDRQGTIWAGTYYGGVNYFNPERDIFSHYIDNPNRNDCLNYPFVGNMIEDKNGDIWICTEGGGLNYLNRKKRTFEYFVSEQKNGLAHNNLKSITYDEEQDMLYIGTYTGGLSKLHIPTRRFYNYLEHRQDTLAPHPGEIIYHTEIYNGYLYISAKKGLFRMDLKTEEFTYLEHYPMNFTIDSKGFLWYSTSGNLYRLNTNDLSDVKGVALAKLGVRFNITKIIEHEGEIYFGTQGSGLFKFNETDTTFTAYTVSSGHLMSNYCYNIAQTNRGELLITGDKGITFFHPQNGSSRFVKLGVTLPITSITDGCGMLVCKNNEIFIGGTDGLTSFHESALEQELKEYSLYFSAISIHNKKVTPDDHHKVLTEALPFTDKVALTYKQNNIIINFASTNHIDIQRNNEYEYRLEGFDSDWNPTLLNSIYYTNLNPGSYRLFVRERNIQPNGGQEISLHIHIAQPWFNTLWAWMGYILITLLILSLIIKTHNTRRALALSLEKEKEEKERNEELIQAKLKFFTSISHEFRTPLTLIISQIELLTQSTSLSPTAYNRILKINKNANRMRDLISELMTFQKLEHQAVTLRVSEQDLVAFLKEIYLSFHSVAIQKKINFKMTTPNPELFLWFDENQLQKVFFNLISNAFKYTHEEGSIDLIIKEEKDTVIVQIIDSGIGLAPEDAKHIFDLFYQAEESIGISPSNPGTGIGLALSQNIVQLHHGEISVQSERTYGTIFSVKLLKGKSHFEKEGETVILYHTDETIKEEDFTPEFLSDKDYEEIENRIPEKKEGERFTVLLVEDNAELLQVLETLFSPIYNVLLARDGEEALQIAMKEKPDLVVSDVLMPRMTGTELCMRIKSNIDLSHIPVVLLTALNSVEHHIEGLQHGADDYIAKPFHSKILLIRCNNIIRNRVLVQRTFKEQPEPDLSLLGINPLDQKLLAKINRVIREHLHEADFDVNSLAQEVGLSRSSLFAKFKSLTGMTPNEFIQNQRLQRATVLLHDHPEMQIAEIAEQLGFGSPVYFSRSFKAKYGVSPAQYRKK